MKNLVLLVVVVAFLCIGFYACEDDPTCKNCKIKKFENGLLVEETDVGEYCDADLEDVEGQDSNTVGPISTIYACD